MPLLAEYAASIGPDHFKGTQILYINHLISDALMTALALKQAGAGVSVVGIPYGATDSDERQWVIEEYRKIGNTRFPVVENVLHFRDQMRSCVLSALAELDLKQGPFMIVEDGGYAFPILHEPAQRHMLEACIGAVEHTARGMWNYQYMEVDKTPRTPRMLEKPAITIANSQLKSRHEPVFVAQAVVHELVSVLTRHHEFLPFKKVTVLGNGRIGKPIADLIRMLGATVETVDPRLNSSEQTGVNSSLNQELFSESTFFVGASGMPSITRDQLLSFLANDYSSADKFFASASSKNVEFEEVISTFDQLSNDADFCGSVFGVGSSVSKENIPEFGLQYTVKTGGASRTFSIIGEGYPIIFYPKHIHGGPSKPFDPVMTQQFLAAYTLREKCAVLENKVYSLDEVRQACSDDMQLANLLDDKALLRRWCELNGIDPASYFRHIRYE